VSDVAADSGELLSQLLTLEKLGTDASPVHVNGAAAAGLADISASKPSPGPSTERLRMQAPTSMVQGP
jgi:hypothetical protein